MNIRLGLGLFAAGLVGLVSVALQPQDAEAVPAFARQYNVSCSLCHAPPRG
jgi:mono/diheme cytochrome c family protein